MFDPYDQVRMRTERLLASAARIREERAVRAARHDVTEPAVTEPAVASPPVRAANGPGVIAAARARSAQDACPPGSACADATPGSTRPRAA